MSPRADNTTSERQRDAYHTTFSRSRFGKAESTVAGRRHLLEGDVKVRGGPICTNPGRRTLRHIILRSNRPTYQPHNQSIGLNYQSIYISTYLYYLPICLSACPHGCLPTVQNTITAKQSMYVYLQINLSTYLCTVPFLSIYLTTLSTYLNIYLLSSSTYSGTSTYDINWLWKKFLK